MSKPPATRAEALKAGLPHYFTGKPCKNGHTAQRNTLPGSCVECLAATRQREAQQFRQAQLAREEG